MTAFLYPSVFNKKFVTWVCTLGSVKKTKILYEHTTGSFIMNLGVSMTPGNF